MKTFVIDPISKIVRRSKAAPARGGTACNDPTARRIEHADDDPGAMPPRRCGIDQLCDLRRPKASSSSPARAVVGPAPAAGRRQAPAARIAHSAAIRRASAWQRHPSSPRSSPAASSAARRGGRLDRATTRAASRSPTAFWSRLSSVPPSLPSDTGCEMHLASRIFTPRRGLENAPPGRRWLLCGSCDRRNHGQREHHHQPGEPISFTPLPRQLQSRRSASPAPRSPESLGAQIVTA